MAQQRYIIEFEAKEYGRTLKFYATRAEMGYGIGFSCQRHSAGEFTKAEVKKYMAKRPNRKVTVRPVQ